MSGVDETHVEYAYQFDDGEVWEGFDNADEVAGYIRASVGDSPDQDAHLFDGHVVKRTRRVVVGDWEHVLALVEKPHSERPEG